MGGGTERRRVAVVDVGSNSTRLLVADVEDGRVSHELCRQSRVTRLGAGVDSAGSLEREAQGRVFDVLEDFRRMIDEHEAEHVVAVLTSAVREASNGQEFARELGERYRLTPHVLSGEQEASLTFLGATSERDPESTTPTLVIDIGGGSTELIIGCGHEASFHVSTRAGVVRQSERHIEHDPPTDSELQALREDVRGILEEAVPAERRRAVRHGIGVAGTATSLAAIAQRLEPYDPERVHGYLLPAAEREQITERLSAMTLQERRELPGLHPDRAPTIIPGVLILAGVMEMFGLSRLEISEHDLLRGAALSL